MQCSECITFVENNIRISEGSVGSLEESSGTKTTGLSSEQIDELFKNIRDICDRVSDMRKEGMEHACDSMRAYDLQPDIQNNVKIELQTFSKGALCAAVFSVTSEASSDQCDCPFRLSEDFLKIQQSVKTFKQASSSSLLRMRSTAYSMLRTKANSGHMAKATARRASATVWGGCGGGGCGDGLECEGKCQDKEKEKCRAFCMKEAAATRPRSEFKVNKDRCEERKICGGEGNIFCLGAGTSLGAYRN